MKIIITGTAAAVDPETGQEILDPKTLRKLDGLLYSKSLCSKYIDARELAGIGFKGGAIRLAFERETQRLTVVTEYQSSRRLQPNELKRLIEETAGQWSDGIGEEEFLYRKKLGMSVDLYPIRRKKIRAEQIDDGIKIKAPRAVPLAQALWDNDLAQAKALIADGADVDAMDKTGHAPLHIACLSGHFDLALLLLERGADARATTTSKDLDLATPGASPLAFLAMCQTKSNKALAVAAALLEHDADVDARDKEGRTPLMWAVNRANLPLVDLLITQGADVNAKDRVKYNESTVLMYAQDSETARVLLRLGADPSIRNHAGQNASEYALMNSHSPGYRQLAALIRAHME